MLRRVADFVFAASSLPTSAARAERSAELYGDAGVGRQITLADDAADRAFAPIKMVSTSRHVLVGNHVGGQGSDTGKMHGLDVVAGAVESRFVGSASSCVRCGAKQRIVGIAQPAATAKNCERPLARRGLRFPAASASLWPFPQATTIIGLGRCLCALLNRHAAGL